MVEVSFEREYEFGAEEVWAVFADFGNVSWVPGVEKVELEGEGVGMIRHLTIPVLPPLQERLELIDPDQRVLEYSIPSVEYISLEDYTARVEVSDLGPGRSRVRISCKAQAVGPEEEASAKTEAFYEAYLGWINDFLEKPQS